MKKIPLKKKKTTAIEIINQGDQLWTTSLDVAEKFGKRHKNVLQSIENLECSEEFKRLNFQPLSHTVRGGTQEYFIISKKGFSLLAMGFSGKKAALWKEKYIDAFEAMTEEIERLHKILLRQSKRQAKISWQQARLEGKRGRREFTDAVQRLKEFALSQNPDSRGAGKYYSNITKMIYKIYFNLKVKKVPDDFRDKLDEKALDGLQMIERQSAQWIDEYLNKCEDYHPSYSVLKQKVQALIDLIGSVDLSVLQIEHKPTPALL